MELYMQVQTAPLGDVRAAMAANQKKVAAVVRGKTLLFAAAARSLALGGAFTAVKILVAMGADVGFRSTRGQTAAFLAAREGNLGALKLLARSGADLVCKDCLGQTVLHYAVRESHLDVCKYLVEHGLGLEHADNNGRAATHYAKKGFLEKLRQAGLFRKTLPQPCRGLRRI